jgi:hypothetical protein
MRTLWALLLVSCAATQRRPVTVEERAEARRRFDEIVRTIDRDALQLAPVGDSLSKQIYELLRCDPAVVRDAEADALRASLATETKRRNQLDAPPEEQVIRFLHELEPRNSQFTGDHGFAIKSGAVVHEPDAGMGFNPWIRAVGKLDVDFESLVGDHALRTYEPARADALFAALTRLDRRRMLGLEDMDLAMALGEACATDPAADAELVRRADRDRNDPRLLVALGWSGTIPDIEMLERRVNDLPPRDRHEVPWGMYPLKAATFALRHAAPEELNRILNSLPAERSDQIAGTLGKTELVMRRLAALDAARDVAGRRDAIARLCRIDYLDAQVPSGGDAVRLLHAYLEGVDSGDPSLRGRCLRAVETTFFGGYTGGGGGSYPLHDGGVDHSGLRQLGSYCGPEPLLRMIVEDLDARRIEFFEAGKEPEGPRVAFLKDYDRPARGSGVKLVDCEELPMRLAADWVERGLRLRLTNDHTERVAVDVVGMRYGGIETVTETITRRDEPTLVRHPITLRLGWLGYAAVHDSSLVVLQPGATYEWVLPVREEFRGRGEIDVESWGLDVLGNSAVPVVRFGMTVVK